jgi:adenylyltransferase/sulfurtransferase
LFEGPPDPVHLPDRTEEGVLGVLPGVIGSIQATEAIKLICNIGDPLIGKMLTYNALDMEIEIFEYSVRANCLVCQTDTKTLRLPIVV